jgi:sterol 14-demethylase
MLLRKLVTDLEFQGYRLPAGALLVVSPHVSHRIPEVFPNPHQFDPDRFGPGREEDKQPYALITFGGGKHRCLGAAFAHMQIKALWSVLFRRYEVELVAGDSYEPDYTRMVVGPRQPCRIRYRRRGAAGSRKAA